MPRRTSRASGSSYIPLVLIALLLLLWVAGVLRIQVSPEVNLPPQVQTPVAGLPDIIGTLPAAISTLGATPAPNAPVSRGGPAAAPPASGQRTKTSGCVSQNALPDSACTPGAMFPNIAKEQICRPGYSQSVRDVPDNVKDQVYAQYGITHHTTGEYEVDHLISLELGGSNDIANLWPEPAEPRPGFHEKDQVENYLHDQVCAGAISLQQAQTEIATNWLAVYQGMPRR